MENIVEEQKQNKISNRYYIAGILVVLLQVIQMYFYYSDSSFQRYFESMLAIWISSKLFCFIVSLYVTKSESHLYKIKMLFKVIFLAECITLVQEIYNKKDRIKSTLLGLIGQIHIYALPVLLVNNYIIIQEENKNGVNIQIYIHSIINTIIVSTCNLLVQAIKNNIDYLNYPLLFQAYSFCRCFIFWHILSQIYYINYLILIVWLVVHSVIAAILAQNLKQDESKLASFMSYIFQLELFIVKEKECDKKNLSNTLEQWSVALYFFFLYFNIVTFVVIKVISNPILVKLDYLIYILFPLVLPGLVWTIELVYNKIVKIENYNKVVSWRAGELGISKTMNKLKQNLMNDGKIIIELDQMFQQNFYLENLKDQKENEVHLYKVNRHHQYYKNLSKDIQDIKLGIKLAYKGYFQNLHFQFQDQQERIQFIISLDKSHNYQQKLILKHNYNKELAIKALDFFQHIVNPEVHLDLDGKEIEVCKVRFQAIRFELTHFNSIFDLNEITMQVLASNYSALAFYKQLSQYVPINPSLVLYDLVESTI